MNAIIQAIVGFYSGTIDLVVTIYQKTIELTILFFNTIYSWLEALLPPELMQIFTRATSLWNLLSTYEEVVSFFVPIYAILTIIISAYLTVASIRTTRWLLSIIPRAFTGLD